MGELPERFAGGEFIAHPVQWTGHHAIPDPATQQRRVLMCALVLDGKVLTPRAAKQHAGTVDVHTLAAILSE